MHPMLNIGIRAAHAAGDHIVKYVDRIQDVSVSPKGRNDFVTEVDRQAEAIIIDTIHRAYPGHSILAEESGAHAGRDGDEFQWVIDPLDGTSNFMHGFPHFAVSIALKHKNILAQAVIYDPLKQELFTASKGGGAYMNRRRIRVARKKALAGALLATGFPYRELDKLEIYLDTFRRLLPLVAGLRRAGSAALDLAYVACGRFDGFWEYGLKQWDIAAGALLVLEAGGLISDIDGHAAYLESGNIIAGNAKIEAGLSRILKGAAD